MELKVKGTCRYSARKFTLLSVLEPLLDIDMPRPRRRLVEHPDVFETPTIYATAFESDAVAFGFYNGKLYHTQQDFFPRWKEEYEATHHKQIPIDSHARLADAMRASFRGIFDREDDYGMGLVTSFRQLMYPAGRIWILRDAVAFWELPKVEHLEAIKKEFGLDGNALLQLTPTGKVTYFDKAIALLTKHEAGELGKQEEPPPSENAKDVELMKQQHLVPDAKKALMKGVDPGFGAAKTAKAASKAGYKSAAAFNAARYAESGSARFLGALAAPTSQEGQPSGPKVSALSREET